MNKGNRPPSTVGTRMPSSALFFLSLLLFFPMDIPVYSDSRCSQNSPRMLSLYRSPFLKLRCECCKGTKLPYTE